MDAALRVESPIGTLLLSGDGEALTGLRIAPADIDEAGEGDALLREAARQLGAYFQGRLRRFELPVAPRGTVFQQRVWDALREIPYGETLSYGELGGRLGVPGGARAVGQANGRNPIAVIIPCHRVVAADNGLGGYSWGLPRKRLLLELEGRLVLDFGQRNADVA